MRVYVYPGDVQGCGHYRLIWPAQVLRNLGHDVRLVVPKGRTGSVSLNGGLDPAGNLVEVYPPQDADVMVFQRVTSTKLAQAVPLLRAQGVAVVVDMDDDLTCVHPANVAWTVMHPRGGQPGHSWHSATRACMDATMVTVSTPALLRTYAPHGRGVVLENAVPEWYLRVPRVDSDVIGWGGSVHSHPEDLQDTGRTLARLTRSGYEFVVVGEGIGVRSALGLDREPRATGLVDIRQWPDALAQLGVGIAPLANTRFNAAKSWLKPLEYSACGVPWVASPRAEYQRVQRVLKTGLLADGPNAWHRHLRTLATDAGLREEMSQQGRSAAADWTIEGRAWRWLEVWEQALKIQRRQAASPFTRI